MSPRLVITADDFGAAVEVNEAVEQAHRQGILTAASLMVGGPAAADAVVRARRLPGLGIGLHLVLTDGAPLSPPEAARLLLGADGRFLDDMAALGARIAFSAAARQALAQEIEAQFAAFAATCLPLDHVNAHRHFHLHPVIAALIRRIGPRYGMRAVRWPIEPRAALACVEPPPRLSFEGLAAGLAAWAGARAWRRAGVVVPDQVFGMAWSGRMIGARLPALLASLPAGLSEIYLHPAISDGFAGAARGYAYAAELAALLAPETRAATARRGVRLGRFADFTAPA